MEGAWKIVEMKAADLPEDVAEGFEQATEGIAGAKYQPVLYCARQIVAGVNHMIVCKQTIMDQDMTEHVVTLTLHQPLPNEDEKWTVVSIDCII